MTSRDELFGYNWQLAELRGLLEVIPTHLVVKAVLDNDDIRTALVDVFVK